MSNPIQPGATETTMADVIAANEAADVADAVIAAGNYTREDLARMRETSAAAIATGAAYAATTRKA